MPKEAPNNYTMEIIDSLNRIVSKIERACLLSHRQKEEVKLLLATKTVSAEKIRLAIQQGFTLIGENKVQEMKLKAPLLNDLTYEPHFIGHLQTNKVKDVLKYATCVQSVDRLELAEALDRRLQKDGRSINIYVQVNTSFEDTKFGVSPSAVTDLLKQIKHLDTLNIKGLMTIGLFDADPERVRPCFSLLRQISDNAINDGVLPPTAKELSMGMSADLETAIQEGATVVRVGTAIFGERNYPDSYYWNEENVLQ